MLLSRMHTESFETVYCWRQRPCTFSACVAFFALTIISIYVLDFALYRTVCRKTETVNTMPTELEDFWLIKSDNQKIRIALRARGEIVYIQLKVTGKNVTSSSPLLLTVNEFFLLCQPGNELLLLSNEIRRTNESVTCDILNAKRKVSATFGEQTTIKLLKFCNNTWCKLGAIKLNKEEFKLVKDEFTAVIEGVQRYLRNATVVI